MSAFSPPTASTQGAPQGAITGYQNYLAANSVTSTIPPSALTAEGLMLYLETRLNGLDEQINGIFAKQQKIEALRKQLGNIQAALAGLNDDKSKGMQGTASTFKGIPTADYEVAITNALNAIEAIDPQLGQSMKNDLSQNGQIMFCIDGLYLPGEVTASREYVNNVIKGLESSSQLEMIRMQSLMSARGTAIQLATNLVSAFSKSTESIVGNIGR